MTILLLVTDPMMAQNMEEPYGNTDDPSLPNWVTMMYADDPDPGLVNDAYIEYYKEHPFIKNQHTQYFKRWIYAIENDVFGVTDKATSKEEEAQRMAAYIAKSRIIAQQEQILPSWSCVGPFDFDKTAASTNYAAGAAHVYTVEQSMSNTNTLYAGSANAGLWKTTDKGSNWVSLTSTLAIRTVYALEIDHSDDNILYFGSGSALYKTTDGGSTISQIGDGVFKGESHGTFREIIMHPSDTNVLYVGTNAGLYKTVDGGANWVQQISGKFWEIEFHPLNPDIIYAVKNEVDSSEFYKTVDGGANWIRKLTGWPQPSSQSGTTEQKRVEISVTPALPNRVYALTTGVANGGSGLYGIYVSNDAGETWAFQCCGPQPAGVPDPVTNPNLMAWSDVGGDNGGQYYYDLALAASHSNGDSLIVAGVNAWYSTDGGVSFTCPSKWSHSYKQNYVHADIHDIKIYGKDIWFACDGGIFYSNDECQNVTRKMYGIAGTDFWGFGAGRSNGNVMIGGTYHNGSLLKDRNVYVNGWVSIFGGDNTRGQVNPHNEQIVYHDYGRLLLPGDRTQNIQGLTYNIRPNTKSNLEFHPDFANTIYSGADSILRMSEDGGVSYTPIYNFGEEIGRIRISVSDPKIMVAATLGGTYDTKYIFRTVDGGDTWTDITPPDTVLVEKYFLDYDLEIDDVDPNIIYLARTPKYSWSSWDLDGHKVFISNDGGNTWTNITTSDLDGEHIRSIAHQKGSDGGLYIGTLKTVYYKNNGMLNWLLFNKDLPLLTAARTIQCDYYNNRVIMGTNRSVWVCDFYDVSQVQADFVVNKGISNCTRDTIYYTDNSSMVKSGASWNWSFPGATYVSSFTTQNPKVVYGSPGTYSVSLTATDSGLVSDTKTKINLITTTSGCEIDTIPGNALQCTSAGDYGATTEIGITSNTITLTAWIKPNGPQNSYTGIVFDNATSAGLNFRVSDILGYHWPGGSWSWNSGLKVPEGKWSYVALVATPDSMTLYLNGIASTHITTLDSANITSLLMGSYKGWGGRNYNGLIDEVKIWNRSLTKQEIRGYRHITLDDIAAADPDLIAYFQFNETTGEIMDRINTYHATITGNASRVLSTAPIGGGESQMLTASGGGSLAFNDVGTVLGFPGMGVYPDGHIVVSRLHVLPDSLPNSNMNVGGYWIINNYGANSVITALDSFRHRPFGYTPTGDLVNGISMAYLYTRDENEYLNSWNSNCFANRVVGGSSPYFNYNGSCSVTNFSQFLITSSACEFSTSTASICNGDSLLIGGTYHKTSGPYYEVLQSAQSCDSVVEVNLSVITVNVAVAQSGRTLSASLVGGIYQWYDCVLQSIIPGETKQSYTPANDGRYAVIITENGCTDTSECYAIENISTTDILFGSMMTIYPNPVHSLLHLDFGMEFDEVLIRIVNSIGQEVARDSYTHRQIVSLNLEDFSEGTYFIHVSANEQEGVLMIIYDQ